MGYRGLIHPRRFKRGGENNIVLDALKSAINRRREKIQLEKYIESGKQLEDAKIREREEREAAEASEKEKKRLQEIEENKKRREEIAEAVRKRREEKAIEEAKANKQRK